MRGPAMNELCEILLQTCSSNTCVVLGIRVEGRDFSKETGRDMLACGHHVHFNFKNQRHLFLLFMFLHYECRFMVAILDRHSADTIA